MKIFLTSGILFILSLSASAQATIDWQNALGGTDMDAGYDITQTTDLGYIVVGSSKSQDGDVPSNQGEFDALVVRLLPNGSILWKKSLGGTGNDYLVSVQQTSEGGFILAGTTYSNDGDVTGNNGSGDMWIVKLTITGTISWQKTFGGSNIDNAGSIQQTSDGGYIVTGLSLSDDGDITGNQGSLDMWVVKLTNSGVISWQKSLGGSGSDGGSCIEETSDGGYVVAGFSSSSDGDVTNNLGGADYWVVKLSSNGTIIWEKSLGGSDSDFLYSIEQTSDGGYILSGDTQSIDGDVTGNHGLGDIWIVKLTNTGALEWEKTLGGSENESDGNARQTSDGGYIVSGTTSSTDGDVTFNNGDTDIWLVKLTSTGAISWEKSFGGGAAENMFNGNGLEVSSDGGFLLTGYATSTDGDVVGNHGGGDFWVVKFSESVGLDENNEQLQISVYPNPAMDQLTINLPIELVGFDYVIHDNMGRTVLTGEINQENTPVELGNLKKGIYTAQILTSEGKVASQFVKK